ncbi:MAG TPA: PKD domain-containing protein [Thermoplasmatales archaeon]|nr:PKD domain-containing protein [Thermoplasmatales archaeon]
MDYNERGLVLAGSSNLVWNNTFSNSSASGIYTTQYSGNNIVYHNVFKDNGKNAQENGDNQWSNNGEGNYWDDYGYVDRNLDGIGDKPYSKNGVVDNYPLGFFLKPPLKPRDPVPEDTATGVGLRITLQVKVEDSDSDYLTVYFYRADTEELLGVDTKVPSGGIAQYSFKQPFDTTFAWYVIVNDSLLENRSDTWFFTTLVTPPDNEPPTADAGGPYSAAPGETVQFDASNSFDPDGEIKFYRWNFGDGTSEILAMQPQHVYNSPGVYTVTLTVIDDKGTTDTDIIDVVIEGEINKKPIAYIDAPTSGVTGESIVFSGVNSTDPDGSIVNYTWYLGENTTLYGPVVVYTYNESGSYLVILTVRDDDGEIDTTQMVISIEKAKESVTGLELLLLIFSMAWWLRRRK